MREMGVQQFYETIGGSSYAAVRRHFLKLVEHGWIRRVREAPSSHGRPEWLYRSTELPVIDTDTFRSLPFSIRDALTVQLLEEMAARIGEALAGGTADAKADRVAAFTVVHDLDELAWCEAYDAIERCFQALLHEQNDAKIRLENSAEKPLSMVVNLAAFETPRPAADMVSRLPKADEALPPPPWPQRVGKVFADRLNLAIIDELNRAAMTPAQLHETLGVTTTQGILRRCRRLEKLGWTVNIDTETGGQLYGAHVYQFRAASPNVTEEDIVERIPPAARKGQSWDAFSRFVATSIDAVEGGTFNHRFDRHLTMSPMLVDEIGWAQVTEALGDFQKTLLALKAAARKRRRRKGFQGFPAAFLLSSFEAPAREPRQ